MKVNKLMGFYELQRLGIPTVPWREFTGDAELPKDRLWTVRVAVSEGSDFHLPRAVGVTADEGVAFGQEMLRRLAGTGLVVYYPFFRAVKSGTLLIRAHDYVVEACEGDLWNLVTYGRRNVTITLTENSRTIHGETEFLAENEITELLIAARRVRRRMSRYLREGREILLEWSIATDADETAELSARAYLVFYECRAT